MSNQPQTGDLLGRTFDRRYRVNELIGSGGMGSVYRATHLEMNREVALKVLERGVADSDKQVQRFYQEARASSRLQHPNTIRVFDFGRADDGRLYLAMEYLRGETLTELLRRQKRLSVDRACHIVRQVCKSLAEAHQVGIVHRDLKPDNIFITDIYGERDFVKVLDFGIAKSTEGEEQESLTQTGFICGTPRYLSPEQAMGKTIDARSDLYSLGVILYEMLSGHPPFTASTPIALVMKHIHEPPPRLPDGGKERAQWMAALVYALMQKMAARRPPSSVVVSQALDDIAKGKQPAGLAARANSVAPRGAPRTRTASVVPGRRRPTAAPGMSQDKTRVMSPGRPVAVSPVKRRSRAQIPSVLPEQASDESIVILLDDPQDAVTNRGVVAMADPDDEPTRLSVSAMPDPEDEPTRQVSAISDDMLKLGAPMPSPGPARMPAPSEERTRVAVAAMPDPGDEKTRMSVPVMSGLAPKPVIRRPTPPAPEDASGSTRVMQSPLDMSSDGLPVGEVIDSGPKWPTYAVAVIILLAIGAGGFAFWQLSGRADASSSAANPVAVTEEASDENAVSSSDGEVESGTVEGAEEPPAAPKPAAATPAAKPRVEEAPAPAVAKAAPLAPISARKADASTAAGSPRRGVELAASVTGENALAGVEFAADVKPADAQAPTPAGGAAEAGAPGAGGEVKSPTTPAAKPAGDAKPKTPPKKTVRKTTPKVRRSKPKAKSVKPKSQKPKAKPVKKTRPKKKPKGIEIF